MEFEKFDIEGIILLKTNQYKDERGLFFESFNQKKFNEAVGKDIQFVQDNVSISKQYVVRGLHLQKPPFAQGKLVRVLKGAVLDIAVDIRKSSLTYGQHVKVKLSAENGHQLWIPEGFAHGFSVLEEDTVFSYKCTNYYHPNSEMGLLFNDSQLQIDWEVTNPIVNQKDKEATLFSNFESPF
jgi:dTDP-4-dehydrorhamnose 3,5-epimerase